MIQSRQLVVTAKNKIEFRTINLPELNDNEILVKTILSGVSHATELATIEKKAPTLLKHWNKKYRIYSGNGQSKKYPCTLGYENVGRIIQLGKKVTKFKIGEIVWTDNPHQQYSIVDTTVDRIYKIPSIKHIKRAIFLALTRVALASVHDAEIKIGDRVAVYGLGTIGLIAIQFASLASQSKCFGIDPIELRRNIANTFGHQTFSPLNIDTADAIHKLTEGKGVDASIESSGSTKGLNEAIRSCRVGGRVALVGTYRQGAKDLFLAEEWHRNRIEMISSMSVNDCPPRDYPRWTLDRLNEVALSFLISGKIEVEKFITQTYSFKNAPKAYQLLQTHPEKTIKIVFDYE